MKNFSPFANIQYDISESLTLSLAGRWENEEREVATTAASGDGVLDVRRQRGDSEGLFDRAQHLA